MVSIENPSDEFLETANMQTLFGKDYYVILRPSLCFNFTYYNDNINTDNNNNINNNDNVDNTETNNNNISNNDNVDNTETNKGMRITFNFILLILFAFLN